jgi:hypothetical protein
MNQDMIWGVVLTSGAGISRFAPRIGRIIAVNRRSGRRDAD